MIFKCYEWWSQTYFLLKSMVLFIFLIFFIIVPEINPFFQLYSSDFEKWTIFIYLRLASGQLANSFLLLHVRLHWYYIEETLLSPPCQTGFSENWDGKFWGENRAEDLTEWDLRPPLFASGTCKIASCQIIASSPLCFGFEFATKLNHTIPYHTMNM